MEAAKLRATEKLGQSIDPDAGEAANRVSATETEDTNKLATGSFVSRQDTPQSTVLPGFSREVD